MRAAHEGMGKRRDTFRARLCRESPLTDWKGITLVAVPGMYFIPGVCPTASAGCGAEPHVLSRLSISVFTAYAAIVCAAESAPK